LRPPLAWGSVDRYHSGMTTRPTLPAAIAALRGDGEFTARQRRHFLLQRLLLRHSVGTGSDLTTLRRRTAMQPWPDLRELLEGISWALVGGVATRAYMPERMTKDMDVLVRQADGPRAVQQLVDGGFVALGHLGIPGQAVRAPDGVEVDVLFGDQPWLDEALAQVDRDAAGFPVIGLPYLVLLKLQAARAQDWADVSRMLGQANGEQLDRVRDVVRRYSPEDEEDLESLIYLGQQELREPGSP
jgi:hypothetical protein